MSNPYFNGVQLPSIPTDFVYTYLAIIHQGNSFSLVGCSQKLWYDSSKEAPALNQNAGSAAYSVYSSETNSWGNTRTVNYYFTYSYILWSNYDIPVGSASASTIHFNGTQPTLTDLHLVNQAETSIGNNVSQLVLTMPRCSIGNLLLLAYTLRGKDNVVTLSDGWVPLGGGNNVSDSSDTYQRVFFAYKFVSSEEESVIIQQTLPKRLYAICSEYFGVKQALIRNDLSSIGTLNYTVLGKKENTDDIMVYATSSAYYSSGRLQSVTPEDLVKCVGDPEAERLACWFDGGLGAIEHSFKTLSATESRDAILECVQLLGKKTGYASEGTLEFQLSTPDSISKYASSVIQWVSSTPEGTECHVYFRKDLGAYLECNRGDFLPGIQIGEDLTQSDLWLKILLSSKDTQKTPELSKMQVWIQDSTDQNVLVLGLPSGNTKSIQNAVGSVKVSYSGGTLRGLGGAVSPFEMEFTPVGLTAKNNPSTTEHLEISSITAESNLMQIQYIPVQTTEHIGISDVTATGALINIQDI